MAVQLIDRFHPRLRAQQQAAIDAGQMYRLEEVELLEPQGLRPLAYLSLLMLIGGLFFFGAINLIALAWQHQGPAFPFNFLSILGWIGANIAAYILVLPLHELLHGLAFSFWGGRPHYGASLPLALYCGAQNQMFRRNQYLVVGLAPLIVITLAALIVTLCFPVIASYLLLASVGNLSGAAGDVIATRRILRHPAHVLIEDTNSGFRIWEIRISAFAQDSAISS